MICEDKWALLWNESGWRGTFCWVNKLPTIHFFQGKQFTGKVDISQKGSREKLGSNMQGKMGLGQWKTCKIWKVWSIIA